MKPVVILRPEPGASASALAARNAGLEAIVMPLFKIAPVEWTAPAPDGFEALLLTSANAPRHAGAKLRAYRHLPTYCVGQATADAALALGLDVAAIGTGGVDSLLDMLPPRLALLHLCGEHRSAPARAAEGMLAVPVYRSAPLPQPDGLDRIADAVVLVHSPRAARRLAELADGASIAKNRTVVAAISAEAAKAAGPGWAAVAVAGEPADSSLLALASRLCNNPG